MKKVMALFITALFFRVDYSFTRSIERAVSVSIIEEVVNGIRFMHRYDLMDGKVSELWAINSQMVKQQEYEDALADAEMAERRRERIDQERQRRQEQEFASLARQALIKKSILIQSEIIAKGLLKIKDPLLIGYLQYNEATFSSASMLNNLEHELAQAQQLANSSELYDFKHLNEVLNTLEFYPQKLMNFYQDSINYAIKSCDDPRVLKKLLELIS